MNIRKSIRASGHRFTTLFCKGKSDSEFAAELESHLQLHIEDNLRAGMTPETARRDALMKLGGVEQTKENCRDRRGLPLLESFLGDLRFGARMLLKSPAFTTVAILTLALGIGANTAIFSLIDAVMLRKLPVEKPDEVMQVQYADPDWRGEGAGFTNPLWEQIRDRQGVFSSAFAWGWDKFDLTGGGAVQLAQGMWVSGDFFQALRLRPAAGHLIANSDDHRGCPAVAVLSYQFWQARYGGADSAVGGTLSLGNRPFEVIGVAPAGFYGMSVGEKFDVAMPICGVAIFDGKDSRLDQRGNWWLQVAGRIKPGVSAAQATARLKVLSPAILVGALPQSWSTGEQQRFLRRTLMVAPAPTGISAGFRREFRQPLDILMGIVALVMLIACANIASLMLARGATRRKEIAMRQALGASRQRMIRQLLTECILLSSAGALMGVLFARWGTALLVRYMSTSKDAIFLDVSPDARVVGFTAAVAVATGILFGLLPALRSTRASLTSAMKGNQALAIEQPLRFGTSRWIVALQTALSLVLLVAAGLLLRSFEKLATLDIGFDRNNVLLVNADLKTAGVTQERQFAVGQIIEDRLRAIPGVVSASRSIMTPLEGGQWSEPIGTDWSKDPRDHYSQTWFNAVSPGYFEALRMPILGGRNFTSGDSATSPKVAIVNQTLARRFFPDLNPLGKTFRIQQVSGQPGPPVEVVGLVRDSKYASAREETHPTAFLPESQFPYPERWSESFELRTGIPPSGLVVPVLGVFAGVNKAISVEFYTLARQVNDSMLQERLLALLSGFFGALALLIAVIGLYGTLSYLVSQRQAEFGIRMALGAQSRSILLLVIRDVVLILSGGIAAGVGISLATVQVLQSLLFGLGARDPVAMTVAVCLLSAVALIAMYLPARRAMRADPIVALRSE